MRRRLVVMLKAPRPGRVKTRLGRDIGHIAAAWWFRHQTGALLRRLRDPRWEIVLAVAPDVEGLQSRVWPADLARVPQGPGDLGDRMRRIFETFHAGPIVIIGGDIPGITQAHIAGAFRALGANEAVFGPATDGGYWLIGITRILAVPRGYLRGVRWSTEHALADSIASLKGLRIAMIDTLRDVDTKADLEALNTSSRWGF